MTDTQLAPARVTIQPSDLFEAACVALENETVQRCVGTLREETPDGQVMYCAEGVIAQVLINAYPDRFSWADRGHLFDRYTRDRTLMLHSVHWNLLHPRGATIASAAALAYDRGSIAGINDSNEASFADIAAVLRVARADVDLLRRP
jgi:hypothetical protein